MSFTATIENKHKQLWARALSSLATISESVMFSFNDKGVTLSAINLTQTSHAEIRLERSFFKRYELHFLEAHGAPGVDGGFDTEAKLPSLNFTVYAKNLCIVFRKLDTEIDYILLQITFDRLLKLTNRLRSEIKSKNLTRKQYSWIYTPVQNCFLLGVPTLYRNRYAEQEKTTRTDELINYIKMEPAFPKHFLELIPPATEDFRLELTPSPSGTIQGAKVALYGFTKAIMKEKEFLKQPMSTTISTGVEDLLDHNFNRVLALQDAVDPSRTVSVSAAFRLRDFKTFMSMCLTPLSTKTQGNPIYPELFAPDASLEVFFTPVPGSPILFETRKLDVVTITFVLLTDGERANGTLPKTYTVPLPVEPVLAPSSEVTLEQAMHSATQIQRMGKLHARRADPAALPVPVPLFVPQYDQELVAAEYPEATPPHGDSVAWDEQALLHPSVPQPTRMNPNPYPAPLTLKGISNPQASIPGIALRVPLLQPPHASNSVEPNSPYPDQTVDESLIQTPQYLGEPNQPIRAREPVVGVHSTIRTTRRLLTPEDPAADDSLGPTQHNKRPKGLFE